MDNSVSMLTLTAWGLWTSLYLAIGAAIIFASAFIAGYVAQTLHPKSHLARYFTETDLFALWIVSMISGISISLLLFLLAVTRFTSENPILAGIFTILAFIGMCSPVAAATILYQAHKRIRRTRKRATHSKATQKKRKK
jgi:predicted membrane-bound spermidine synthase